MAFLASKPELDAGAIELARAYTMLATEKLASHGALGPIPARAVWAWEDRNGVTDPVMRRHLEDVFLRVDAALGKKSRKAASEKERPRPEAKSPGRRRLRQ